MGKRIAIVGSGVSGIGALWALQQQNTTTAEEEEEEENEVHLYEQGERLGGHTNTVEFEALDGDGEGGEKKKVAVDTGFIVLNTATYREFDLFRPRSFPCWWGCGREGGRREES